MTEASRIDAVLAAARSQIGVTEANAYRYRAIIGTEPGTAWCVPFVAWCLVEGTGYLPITAPDYCSARLRRWGRRRGLIRTDPQRGDIFLHTSKEGQRSLTCWHVGLVEEVQGDGIWLGIDGNGFVPQGEVSQVRRRRHRTEYHRTLFLRWAARLAMDGGDQ